MTFAWRHLSQGVSPLADPLSLCLRQEAYSTSWAPSTMASPLVNYEFKLCNEMRRLGCRTEVLREFPRKCEKTRLTKSPSSEKRKRICSRPLVFTSVALVIRCCYKLRHAVNARVRLRASVEKRRLNSTFAIRCNLTLSFVANCGESWHFRGVLRVRVRATACTGVALMRASCNSSNRK